MTRDLLPPRVLSVGRFGESNGGQKPCVSFEVTEVRDVTEPR